MALQQQLRAARPALRRLRAVRTITRNPAVRALLRVRVLWRNRASAKHKGRAAFTYLLSGTEVSNFTYPIANNEELAEFVTSFTGQPAELVGGLLAEVDGDSALKASLARKLQGRADRQDVPYFGRRMIWYALIRIEKPRLVVETGIHDGLGSALIVAALQKNASEGSPGKLHSFDIDPGAGWLVDDAPSHVFSLHEGDIRKTLGAALDDQVIDFFIHDSLHTYDHELFEYEFALAHRGARLILVSDNAKIGAADDGPETTFALRDLALRDGAKYSVFREIPLNHFVAGETAALALYDDPASPSLS